MRQALLIALRLARAVDAGEHNSNPIGREMLVSQVLAPIAKFWVRERGSTLAQAAMECLRGNGNVEEQGEGVMARIDREMRLNSIWEGAGNILASDLLHETSDVFGTLPAGLDLPAIVARVPFISSIPNED